MNFEQIKNLMSRFIRTSGFNDPCFVYMVHYDSSITVAYLKIRVEQTLGIRVDPEEVWRCAVESPLFQTYNAGRRFKLLY